MKTMTTSDISSLLKKSASFALQWRLLLLWVLVLLVPTFIITLPLWRIISLQLNHSVLAGEFAQHLNMNAINDIISVMVDNKLLLQEAGVGALILTLLLSPLLSGAIITAARSPTSLPIGKLIHGGMTEYWRMFRMLICALIPFGIAGAIGSGVMHLADNYGEQAILQSDAEFASHAATAVMIILLVIADATLDAGRAQFINHANRCSVIIAWWRGLKLIVTRPLQTLGVYVAITLIGLIAAAVLALLRLKIGHIHLPGFILGLVLTQLLVVSLAWIKTARLFGLAAVSK